MMKFVKMTLEFREALRRLLLGWLCPCVLKQEDYRNALNESLKKHWPEHVFEVYELIQENYDPDTKDKQAGINDQDNQFIVFINLTLDIDWITKKNLDQSKSSCVTYAESISARRCHHLPKAQKLEFRTLIGQAIVNAICGAGDQSRKLADSAAQFLKERTIERSRYWTLLSAHAWILLLSLATPLLWYTGWFAPDAPIDGLLPFWTTVQGGLIGAYLSVVQRAGSGEWDAASGLKLHILEVFTKLIAGGFFGAIAFALAHSAAPAIKTLASDIPSAFILGVAVGFIERAIPKFISGYAESLNQKGPIKHEAQSSTN